MEANKQNMVIYLPFDESSGSDIAYDHSASRADGVVTDADFVSGKVGNAIKFQGKGKCEVTPSIINLSNDFTLMGCVNPLKMEVGSPTKAIWLLSFSGFKNYVEVSLEVRSGQWVSLAVTKKDTLFTFYVNGIEVKQLTNGNQLIGLSLNQNSYGGDYGQALLDDFKAFDEALSIEAVKSQQFDTKKLEYYLNGISLKDYGVYVSASDGLLDRPKMKTPASLSWDNYHGESVDLYHKFYESREITLSCFIKADGKNDFIARLNKFMQLFDERGTHRLLVDVHPTKPLVYEVYSESAITIKKTWNSSLMIGTFTLTLKEPAPVKRVLKHIRISEETKTVSITISTIKLVDIFWGDGQTDFDVYGTDKTITHTYADNGDYYIVVTGDIDAIESFDTNAIIVWNKL